VTSFGFSVADTELLSAVGVALQSLDAAVPESSVVELEANGGGEGPSETCADGEDCPQSSHRDEEKNEK
jgi:hypothetical protein